MPTSPFHRHCPPYYVLRPTFHTLKREDVLGEAAAASDNPFAELDKLHRQAASTISGCIPNSRNGVRLREAGLMSTTFRTRAAAANLYERLRRFPPDNRARAVAEAAPPKEGDQWRPTWPQTARRELEGLGVTGAPREPIPTRGGCPPWQLQQYNVDCRPDLVGRTRRKDGAAKRKQAWEDTVARLPKADLTGYTDGSVPKPRKCGPGGGAYILTDAAGTKHTGKCAAGARSTSYRAELRATPRWPVPDEA